MEYNFISLADIKFRVLITPFQSHFLLRPKLQSGWYPTLSLIWLQWNISLTKKPAGTTGLKRGYPKKRRAYPGYAVLPFCLLLVNALTRKSYECFGTTSKEFHR